jgi:hypothetical protein
VYLSSPATRHVHKGKGLIGAAGADVSAALDIPIKHICGKMPFSRSGVQVERGGAGDLHRTVAKRYQAQVQLQKDLVGQLPSPGDRIGGLTQRVSLAPSGVLPS